MCGHGLVLQPSFCTSAGHGLACAPTGGLVTVRVRVVVPPPQLFSHADQSVHFETSQKPSASKAR